MSKLHIGNLARVTPSQLRSLILSSSSSQSIAIVDVRDDDYIGGHIHSSQNIPSSTHDTALPELVRTLQDKKIVIFHCMLSQQRGPSAALRYARERQRLLKSATGGGDVVTAEDDGDEVHVEGKQKVAVLERGFEGWVQSGYGTDERLTEGFVKDLWEDHD